MNTENTDYSKTSDNNKTVEFYKSVKTDKYNKFNYKGSKNNKTQ